MRKFVAAIFLISVVATVYSCKKKSEPLVSLLDIKEFASSTACPNGGIIINVGVDKNRNNVLDQDEVSNTKSVCNGQSGTNGSSDRVIILTLFSSSSSYGTSSPTGVIHPAVLVKFFKRNYVGVDSIKFVANPLVTDASTLGMVQLYDVTDSVPIANSTLTTNITTPGRFLESNNVFSFLPEKEITLGVRLLVNSGSGNVFVSSAFLVLYRK
jgi:hypothetical protein